MGAVLEIGRSLGISPVVMAELLPPIEAVAISEMNKRSGEDG